MASVAPVSFHFVDVSFKLQNRLHLKDFIRKIFTSEGVYLSRISFVFCSDAHLLPINQDFLNHETLTDIITFSLGDPNCPIVGEVYISIDRIKDNAQVFKTTFNDELHRVIFHGVLHLCGYADKSNNQKAKMRERENFYLAKYFVSRETF